METEELSGMRALQSASLGTRQKKYSLASSARVFFFNTPLYVCYCVSLTLLMTKGALDSLATCGAGGTFETAASEPATHSSDIFYRIRIASKN